MEDSRVSETTHLLVENKFHSLDSWIVGDVQIHPVCSLCEQILTNHDDLLQHHWDVHSQPLENIPCSMDTNDTIQELGLPQAVPSRPAQKPLRVAMPAFVDTPAFLNPINKRISSEDVTRLELPEVVPSISVKRRRPGPKRRSNLTEAQRTIRKSMFQCHQCSKVHKDSRNAMKCLKSHGLWLCKICFQVLSSVKEPRWVHNIKSGHLDLNSTLWQCEFPNCEQRFECEVDLKCHIGQGHLWKEIRYRNSSHSQSSVNGGCSCPRLMPDGIQPIQLNEPTLDKDSKGFQDIQGNVKPEGVYNLNKSEEYMEEALNFAHNVDNLIRLDPGLLDCNSNIGQLEYTKGHELEEQSESNIKQTTYQYPFQNHDLCASLDFNELAVGNLTISSTAGLKQQLVVENSSVSSASGLKIGPVVKNSSVSSTPGLNRGPLVPNSSVSSTLGLNREPLVRNSSLSLTLGLKRRPLVRNSSLSSTLGLKRRPLVGNSSVWSTPGMKNGPVAGNSTISSTTGLKQGPVVQNSSVFSTPGWKKKSVVEKLPISSTPGLKQRPKTRVQKSIIKDMRPSCCFCGALTNSVYDLMKHSDSCSQKELFYRLESHCIFKTGPAPIVFCKICDKDSETGRLFDLIQHVYQCAIENDINIFESPNESLSKDSEIDDGFWLWFSG